MRKGHSITGLQVVAQDSGKDLGKVLDLIFDHDADQCLALVLREKGLLHSAQIVRFENIISIGKDAVLVGSEDSVINPHDDARLRVVLERDTHLSGTKILTENGQDLGTFADVYLDEKTGRVVGYEVSGGFVSDTMSGKRYVSAERTHDLRVGDDVLIADPVLASEFEQQAQENPEGLKGALQSASEKVSGAYDSAKNSVTETYANLAESSVEKQKEFVVGKTAGKDVFLPAPTHTATDVIVEDHAPILATDELADDLKHGPVLVHGGEQITQAHADHAAEAGILHQLLVAAGAHSTGQIADSAKEKLAGAQSGAQNQLGESKATLEERAIGQRAGKEVDLPNGSTLVAPGMTITHDMMETAKLHGKEGELLAAAGLGAQNAASSAGETATNVWEAIKEKTAELTGVAQEKKGEMDAAKEQKRINNALGRPVTRVILAKDDSVILNTGDIITHKAIEMARQNEMLDVLLDSVYTETPELSPEALRVTEPGKAALV